MAYRALIVDDDDELAFGLCKVLSSFGFKARHARTVDQALQRYLREETFHLAICDLRFPDPLGLTLIEQLHEACPATYTVMLTAFGEPRIVRLALKRGAVDYFDKPMRNHQLERLCKKVMESVPSYLPNKLLVKPRKWVEFEGMRSCEKSMLTAFDGVRDAAPLRSIAYLIGEPGVGKGSLARAIHNRSSVADGPFLTLNADSYSGPRLEQLLFGFERADNTSPPELGLIERAHTGTLYIENVAGLDRHTQAQLLQFIKLGQYRRIGSNKDHHATTRILASQSGNPDLISAGGIGLNAELEHLLHSCILRVPALRERRRDIPLLSNQILEQLRASGYCKTASLSAQAEERLRSYDWPGNLPELESVIRSSTFRTHSAALQVMHLPQKVSGAPPVPDSISVPLGMKLAHIERQVVLQTLHLHRGNRSATAYSLGIDRRTLQLKLNSYAREQLALGPDSPVNAAADEGAEDSATDSIIVKPKRR